MEGETRGSDGQASVSPLHNAICQAGACGVYLDRSLTLLLVLCSLTSRSFSDTLACLVLCALTSLSHHRTEGAAAKESGVLLRQLQDSSASAMVSHTD